MLDVCTDCGLQIYHDNGSWVDHSGGDVCGVVYDNSPHRPHDPRTTMYELTNSEKEDFGNYIGGMLLDHNRNLGKQFE